MTLIDSKWFLYSRPFTLDKTLLVYKPANDTSKATSFKSFNFYGYLISLTNK